jgi:bifunctional non-homologous end joining protein LigD
MARANRLTNPNRIIDAASGTSKRDLYAYYETVMERMFPHLENRPVSIVRCPEGIAGECFFQRHVLHDAIPGLKKITVEGQAYLCTAKPEGVLELVQFGAVEFHPWRCSLPKLSKADRIVFDLDPAPDVTFDRVVDAAFLLREKLQALGLAPFAKTTGGKGVHLVCPIKPEFGWSVVKPFSKTVAASLAAENPDRFTTAIAKSKRTGKIFIDYLRNDHHATAIAPYSVRAKPGLPMACPVRWSALRSVHHADQYNIKSIAARLRAADPWNGFFSSAVSLKPLLKS